MIKKINLSYISLPTFKDLQFLLGTVVGGAMVVTITVSLQIFLVHPSSHPRLHAPVWTWHIGEVLLQCPQGSWHVGPYFPTRQTELIEPEKVLDTESRKCTNLSFAIPSTNWLQFTPDLFCSVLIYKYL